MFILQRLIATNREILYFDYKFLIKTACKQTLLNFLTRNLSVCFEFRFSSLLFSFLCAFTSKIVTNVK